MAEKPDNVKIFDDDVVLANYDINVIFPTNHGRFGAIRRVDCGSMV